MYSRYEIRSMNFSFMSFPSGRQCSAGMAAMLVALILVLNVMPARASDARMYTYTTVQGDNLRRIAKKQLLNGTDWRLLQKTNALKNPDVIAVGSRLKIPVDAMRMEPALVKVLSTKGIVGGATNPNSDAIKAGAVLNEGAKISTGDDGFVTLQLADGSTLTVQSKSSVRLENIKQFANSNGVTDSVIRLDSGRVETTVATQRNSGARYEILTPTSNMGVRGTVFRVAADSAGTRASSEVLEGLVVVAALNINAAAKYADVALNQGFGTVAEANKPPLAPIALLPAPRMAALAKRVNDTNIEFKFSAIAKAVKYRGQLARDQAFKNPVADVLSDVAEGEVKIRFGYVAAGEYFLRVRAIDGLGLEGNNGEHAFTVVKPLAAPLQNAQATVAKFAWSPLDGATGYRLQVATDEKFNTLLIDEKSLTALDFSPLKPLPYGNYFWRVLAIGEAGVEGAFSTGQNWLVQGDAIALEQPQVDGARVMMRWDGNANQLYQIQIARDERFHDVVANSRVVGSTFNIDTLPKGFYFARVRAISASSDGQMIDGITAWSETRNIDIYQSGFNPNPPR